MVPERSNLSATALFGVVALFLAPQTAQATAFCNLKQTKDGFVALRNEPRLSGKLVGRMRPEDEVLLGEGRHGDWQEVTWWRGNDRLMSGFDRAAGRGWVHRRLIADECG